MNKKPKSFKNRTTVKLEERKSGTFTIVPNSILNNPDVSPTAKILLIQILSDNDSFTLSQSLYAERMGVTTKTIYNALDELVDEGFIRKTPIDGVVPGHKKANSNKILYHYTISEFGNLRTPSESNPVPTENENSIIQTTESKMDVEVNNDVLLHSYLETIIQYYDFDGVQQSFHDLIIKHSKESGLLDFNSLKFDMNKVIKKVKKQIYNACFDITTTKEGTKKAVAEFTSWLKDEVFKKNHIPDDYEKKWLHIRLQNKATFQTDWETEQADKREEEYYDNH